MYNNAERYARPDNDAKEQNMEKLLVFIPAYNCEKQVTRVLSQLLDKRIAPWVGECIVVNNRATDGTESAVQDLSLIHI